MKIEIELPDDIYQRLVKQAIYEGLTEHDWCRKTLTKKIRKYIENDPLPEDIESEKQYEKQKMERFLNAKNREEELHKATIEFLQNTTAWMEEISNLLRKNVAIKSITDTEE